MIELVWRRYSFVEMTSAFNKEYSTISNYPRALSSIIVSVGLLAVFITFASWILVSHPIGTVVRSYFYGVDNTSDTGFPVTLQGAHDGEIHNDVKSDMGGANELPKSEVATELTQNQSTSDSRKQDLLVSSSNDTMPNDSFPTTDTGSDGAASASLPMSETLLGTANSKDSVDSDGFVPWGVVL